MAANNSQHGYFCPPNEEDQYFFHRMKGHNVYQFHCPEKWCLYARGSERHFPSMKLIKQHYMKVHAERKYKCDKCGTAYGLQSCRDRHQPRCGVMYHCADCPAKYTTRESLQYHCRRQEHNLREEDQVMKKTTCKTREKPAVQGSGQVVNITQTPIVFVTIQNTNNTVKPPLQKILPKPVRQMKVTDKCGSRLSAAAMPSHSLLNVKQNAIMQTDIFGVHHLSVSELPNLASKTTKGVSGWQNAQKIIPSSTSMSQNAPVAKRKLQLEPNHVSPRRKKLKSTTGMQTSMSLLRKKKVKTVTGTQTSGDYILKKAMLNANIPIHRKTVASQVTPLKSVALKHNLETMCTIETQTSVTPPESDHPNNGYGSGVKPSTLNVIFPNQAESQTMTDLPPSISTQTLQSFLEHVQNDASCTKDGMPHINGSSTTTTHSFSQATSEWGKQGVNNDDASPQPNVVHIYEKPWQQSMPSASTNTAITTDRTNINSSTFVTDMTTSFIGTKVSTCTPQYTSTNFINTGQVQSAATNMPDVLTAVSFGQTSNTLSNYLPVTGTINRCDSIDNVMRARRITPLVPTTSSVVFSPGVTIASQASANHSFESTSSTATCSTTNSPCTDTVDENRIITLVDDKLLSGISSSEIGDRINSEVQTMFNAEFEQLLQSSGIFFNTDNISSTEMDTEHDFLNSSTQQGEDNVQDIAPGKKITFHSQLDTEFDFLSSGVNTIDMNTQTATDLSLFDSCNFSDMNTQTQLVDIDFLDMVMTNMETQTSGEGDPTLLQLLSTGTKSMAVGTTDVSSPVGHPPPGLVETNSISVQFNNNKLNGSENDNNVICNSTSLPFDELVRNGEQTFSGILATDMVKIKYPSDAVTDMQTQTASPAEGSPYERSNMETQTIFDDEELRKYWFD